VFWVVDMCITSAAARLSSTRILSCPLGEKQLLAYSNSAINLAGQPNSMILPVPGTLSESDFIDSTPFANFMEDLEHAWTPRSRSLGMSKGFSPPVDHFKVGMYEVFLAHGDPFHGVGPMSGKTTIAERIIGKKHRVTEALERLPEDRRPAINRGLLEFFDQYYPGWSLVVCVFESGKKMESQPVMFTYTPFDAWKNKAFFPAVDAHDGMAPDLTEHVGVDHFLFTEHPDGFAMNELFRSKPVPDYLRTKKFVGAKFSESLSNGDWVHTLGEGSQGGRFPTNRHSLFRRSQPHAA
jgi:hypothetical protein